MQKRCMYCGRYFTPDKRVGNRQLACTRASCRAERKKRSQENWRRSNPEYFTNHYSDYVKPWRQKKRVSSAATLKDKAPKVIKDKIPSSKPYRQLILLIPEDKAGVIKDEIRLRRVDISTFAACGP